jgi:dihydroxy-acid dehydratase
MDKKAFENAITVIIALGGSTNAVLHMLAMANAANVDIQLSDFTRIGANVPMVAMQQSSIKQYFHQWLDATNFN